MLRSLLSFLLLMTMACGAALADMEQDMSDQYRQKGWAALQGKDPQTALMYYQRALAFNDQDPEVYNDLGFVLEQLGRLTEAKEKYQKAIELDPSYLPVYMNLGKFYVSIGEYGKALYYLRIRVEKGQPTDPWTLKAQEQIEAIYTQFPSMRMERIQDKAKAFEKELAIDMEEQKWSERKEEQLALKEAYEQGMRLMNEHRYAEAIPELEKVLTIDPHNAMAMYSLRRAHFEIEKMSMEATVLGL